MKKFKFSKVLKYKGFTFNKFNYGTWAIQTNSYGIISVKHIAYIKQYLQKRFKKFKQFKFNLNINKIVTKKPLNTRMGGGKGSISELEYVLKPGCIFLEFYNINSDIMFSIFRVIKNKISIKLNLITI